MEKQTQTQWVVAHDAWRQFTQTHPQLGYRPGYWVLANFLRYHRDQLLAADVIRKARGRFWIADLTRFSSVAFDLATGKCEKVVSVDREGVGEK